MKINDPVYVAGKGSAKRLEGVVAFLGPVEFAEGDDWVGVRLTGSSVGQGKNDGSVKGHQYFQCSGPNGGLFVRKTQITKRILSKLEELRLRRELAQGNVGGGDGDTVATASTASTSTTPRPLARSRSPGPTTGRLRSGRSRSPVPTAPKSGGAPKSKSRLEELRQRRAALTSGGAAAAESSATPSSTPQQQQRQKLEHKIEQQDQQISTLTDELQQLKQQQQADQERIQQLQKDLEQKEEDLKKQPALAAAPADTQPAAKDAKKEEDWNKLQDELKENKQTLLFLTKDIQKQQNQHAETLSKKDTLIKSIQAELRALSDTSSATQQRDASQYKELAKSQAEFSAMKRKYEQVCEEKVQLESSVEDLTLDKEQLMEEKDAFEERLEEFKIDVETAQMECEELRMELENARSATASALQQQAQSESASSTSTSTTNDDMAQVLATQNARLREALIRLREQSSQEKMELIRQLKLSEKAEQSAKKLQPQLDNMKVNQQTMEEQMEDLKDMVEQGAAFEGMVEDLSDRLLSLEEDNSQLRITIRELEEAQELTTEMEEVQAEELKAMNLDIDNRDSVIRNLEEAIKMQRRREEDFSRTVSNYRTMVETLKREKEALLELQHGGEGERSSLIASSQKALARAAQLVSDAAEMRKREAQALMDRIEGQIQYHLAMRYERMLPRSVASQELSAIKGELLASKVASMASHSLHGISVSFTKSLRFIPILANAATTGEEKVPEEVEEGGEAAAAAETGIQLSDEAKQEISTMVHQSECAHVLINTSIDLLRLLLAGHWPDLLSEQGSTELGILLGHSISELDLTLRNLLKSLKEEGVLSPHQTSSSLIDLQQTLSNTLLNLQTDIKESDHVKIPDNWNPPGLQLFQMASYAKFTCLGVVSIVTTIAKDLNENENSSVSTGVVNQLRSLLMKLGHLGNESNNAFAKLSYINIQNTSIVTKLSDCVMVWKKASDDLFTIIKATFSSSAVATDMSLENIAACEKSTDNVLRVATQFSSALRSGMSNTAAVAETTTQQHPLSPETDDFWSGISKLVQTIRKTDGDEEDVNFLFRARAIEHRLTDALEKEPKLSLANAKVTSLEKSLGTRSKEIAMQNARLSELEKLLAKTSSRPASATTKKSAMLKSSEELNSLREENRVLMEAMDVLQRQVDEYENEIRVLNSMKTPKKGSRNVRRSSSAVSEYSTRGGASGIGSGSGGGSGGGGAAPSSSPFDQSDQQTIAASSAAIGALEAALFRPALNNALRDAARWKSKALTESLLQLPPLSVPVISEIQHREQEESKEAEDYDDDSMGLLNLSNALSDFRMEQASIQIVSLDSSNKSSRTLLRESKAGGAAAAQKLDEAAAYAKRSLMNRYGDAVLPAVTAPTTTAHAESLLVGKLKLGDEPYRSTPTTVCKEDLFRLQMHLVL